MVRGSSGSAAALFALLTTSIGQPELGFAVAVAAAAAAAFLSLASRERRSCREKESAAGLTTRCLSLKIG